MSAEGWKWADLYDRGEKHPITRARLNELRQSLDVGDTVRIPLSYGDTDFRPQYNDICTVTEKYQHFIVVDHGKWRESVNYVDFLVNGTHLEILENEPDEEEETYPNAYVWKGLINRFREELGNA